MGDARLREISISEGSTILNYFLLSISQEWDGISLEAKNLISHLLVRDATKRYTTDMILQHSWIEEVTVLFLISDLSWLVNSFLQKQEVSHSHHCEFATNEFAPT